MASITIEGVEYPLRASMRAWKEFETNTGMKMASIADADVTAIPELLYYCAAAGCRRNAQAFELTLDDWMDSITTNDLLEMQEMIQELLGVKKK
jgi:hypothetical protein